MNFEFIFAQNICFFDVAKSIANKVNSIKINKINSMKINKIMKNVENEINNEIKNEITNDFENICEIVTNNKNSLNVDKTISFDVKISKKIDLNFF